MKTHNTPTPKPYTPNRQRLKALCLIVLTLLVSLGTKAADHHDLEAYVEDIAANNPRLAAYRAQRDAAVAGNRVGLTLPDPEVEFASLWSTEGSWRYDISASQEFGFGTLLGSRRKLARSRNELAEIECQQAEQLVRLAAVQLLCRISAANLKHRELDMRHKLIAHHDSTMQRLLNKGEVSKFDRNKTQVILADNEATLMREEVNRQLLFAELRGMGCTLSAEDFEIDEPRLTAALNNMGATTGTTAQMQMAAATQRERIAGDELRSARHEGLPTVSLGYRSETEPDVALRGFGVSVSIPLWSNRSNVRRAKTELAAAAADVAATQAEIESQREILRIRTAMLKDISARTAQTHAQTSPTRLLHKALHAGEISLTDYLLEIEDSYNLYDKYLEANAEYLEALAELLLLGGE